MARERLLSALASVLNRGLRLGPTAFPFVAGGLVSCRASALLKIDDAGYDFAWVDLHLDRLVKAKLGIV